MIKSSLRASGAVAALSCFLISGCYETTAPALERGEQTQLVGTFKCTNRISGEVKFSTYTEQREGIWPIASYTYMDEDGDPILMKKLSSGLTVLQARKKNGSYGYGFVDFIDNNTALMLVADIMNKSDYIESLAKKYKIRAKEGTGGNIRLEGEASNLLLFYANHDKALLSVVLKCERSAGPPPALAKTSPNVQPRPPSSSTSPPTHAPAQPKLPSDPALSLPVTKVDPTAKNFVINGFVGLRVGHTTKDARIFFARDIVDQKQCGSSDPRWTVYSPKGITGVSFATNSAKLVAFLVETDEYQTVSGLKVGDPESKLLEQLGKSLTVKRKARSVESGAHRETEYVFNSGTPNTMRILVRNGAITAFVFGLSREVDNFLTTC